MNSYRNLKHRLVYTIVADKFGGFRNWMEENFLRKISDTGYFFSGVDILPDEDPIGFSGFKGVTYTLKPASEEEFRIFVNEELPALKNYFHEEWIDLLRVNKLIEHYGGKGWEREILNSGPGLTKTYK